MKWKELMQQWTPQYEYERPMTPFVSAIRAANLTPEKIGSVEKLFGLDGWTHDRAQNIMAIPPDVADALRAGRVRREMRAEARRPHDFSENALFLRRISARGPGEILAKQEKRDYIWLLWAHRTPGVSMTHNLQRAAKHNATAARLSGE